MAEQLPDLEARLRLDTSELSGAVGRASAIGSAIGSAVGNLAAQGISAGISAVTGFVSGSVDAFAALEDAVAAAGVTFGAAVGQVASAAEDAATRVGISQRAYTDAANTFGTYGKAAGLAEGDLATFSTGLTDLAGDLASFRGTSTEQAIEAVGAALRGEMEPIRAYGVLLDDATLRQEALALGLITTTKDALTPQQKVLAAQSAILKQTTDAQGDYARTSTSTANVERTRQAVLENTQAVLGEKLAPAWTAARLAATQALLGIADGIDRFWPVVENLGARVGPVLDRIGVAFGAVRDLVATGDFTGGIGKALGGVPEDSPLVNALLTIRDVAGQVAATAGPVLAQLVQQFTAAGIGVGATLLPALERLGTFLVGTAVPALAQLGGFIAQQVLPVVGALGGLIANGLLPILAQMVAWLAGSVVPTVLGVVLAVAGHLQPALAAVSGFLVGVVAPAFQQLLDKVLQFVQGAQPFVTFLLRIIGIVLQVVAAIIGFLVPIILRLAGPVLGALFSALGTVIGWLGNVLGWLGRAGNAFLDLASKPGLFRDAVLGAVATALATVASIPGRIQGALGNLGTLLLAAGRSVVNGLIEGIRDRIGALADQARRLAQTVRDFLPFSPARRGPLRDNPPDRAGRAIGTMLAEGMASSTGVVAAAAAAVAGAAGVSATGSYGVAAAGLPGPGGGGVRVFIGDRELTDLVRVEVDGWAEQQATALTGGWV